MGIQITLGVWQIGLYAFLLSLVSITVGAVSTAIMCAIERERGVITSTRQLDNNPPHPTSIAEWDDMSLEWRLDHGGVPHSRGGEVFYVMPSREWFAYFDDMEDVNVD